ncbi:MAG: acetylxylan esterase [Armatimonadetes bacterium]|nr:acetylxylan esterase [Armatimonadota bacterium]
MLHDRRLTEVRHLNEPLRFPGYARVEDWEQEAAQLRRHILVTTGLWPFPEKTPLRTRRFGKNEGDGFTVEKVYFESYPGFLCTGNLYLPVRKKGPFPGVLNPHGHWATGRIEDQVLGSIPARCLTFARQGYAAFAYDMVGYNDSMQVDHQLAGERNHLWGISSMGLQLWNSLRAVDFLCSQPEVDPTRIGCTGASGGGTQTFMLTGIEDRVKVAAPVNMISAHMQGGCVCENAPSLRLDYYNVQIASLMAPRPMLMVSATGDWTKNTPVEEYPDVKSIYRLYGAEGNVESVQFDAPHNYNLDSRNAVYRFFARWLLEVNELDRFTEKPYKVQPAEFRIFHSKSDLPKRALAQSGVVRERVAAAKADRDRLLPKSASDLPGFKDTLGSALQHALAARQPDSKEIKVYSREVVGGVSGSEESLVLGRKGKGDRIPGLMLRPPSASTVAIVVSAEGIPGAIKSGKPGPVVKQLLKRGNAVFALSPFATAGAQDRRDFSDVAHATTYNRTPTMHRVQDLLTAVAYLSSRREFRQIHLIGLGEAGLWVFLARSLTQSVGKTAVDLDCFNDRTDADFLKRLYVPLLRRAGDFLTAAALIAPASLLLHNAGDKFSAAGVKKVYANLGGAGALTVSKDRMAESAIVDWIT